MAAFKHPVSGEGGVWLSYYSDRSAVYVHANELQALRAVVGGSAGGDSVLFVRWGESLGDAEERCHRELMAGDPS